MTETDYASRMNWNYSPIGKAKSNERSRRKRRALLVGNGPCDNITLLEVFMKDEGLCGICKVHLEDNDKGSIDHIIPICLGGTHTWDNVQLAHLACNLKKGSRLDYKISTTTNILPIEGP